MELKFGIKDYIEMFKARGIRLPINYFIENQLFDIKYKTETHIWMPKEYYSIKPTNFDNSTLYMASWTSIVKKSTFRAISIMNEKSSQFQFFDIGCGKGKVLCLWELLLRNNHYEFFGVEFNKELAGICERNLKIIKSKKTSIIRKDILDIDFSSYGKYLLIYMFNPFNEKIMIPFLDKLKNKSVVMIYNNPVHSKTILDNGFVMSYENNDWHPNAAYNIYKKL